MYDWLAFCDIFIEEQGGTVNVQPSARREGEAK